LNSIDGFEEVWAPRPAVADALGPERVASLGTLSLSINELDDLTYDAGTIEVVLAPLDKTKARRWEQRALARREDWMFAKSLNGEATLAIDEPHGTCPYPAVLRRRTVTRTGQWSDGRRQPVKSRATADSSTVQ
jgi:hypothetical protein